MPTTDRLSNIARARVAAVVLDEASGRERAATEVFNKVDADGDGTITKQEFAPFYEKLKSQAYHDAEVKQRAENKIFKLKGRSRALIGGLGAAALFLLVSILLNFAMTFGNYVEGKLKDLVDGGGAGDGGPPNPDDSPGDDMPGGMQG